MESPQPEEQQWERRLLEKLATSALEEQRKARSEERRVGKECRL